VGTVRNASGRTTTASPRLTRASVSAYDPSTRRRPGPPAIGVSVTDLQTAGEPDGSAASLAAAVLDEDASRQAAQARAKEQVIFPDDLLPGVNSDPVSMRDAFAKGGVAMFVVLGLLVSL